MTGAGILTDFLKLMDKNSNDTEYRALALIWLDLVLKDIGARQDGFHWRFLEAKTYFATALDDYDYLLTTVASDIDTTKALHIYDKTNDITYNFMPYEIFKRRIADEKATGGDPYIFSIFAGNLLLWPTPDFTPVTGTTSATVANKLSHAAATFITSGVQAGMIATDTAAGTKALITTVDSEILLTLDTDIFVAGEAYSISFAIHLDYVKVIGDAADSTSTILIPDKYKSVVYEGMMMWGFKFDPEMGSWADQQAIYEAGIQRMRNENSSNVADLGRPVSHREKYALKGDLDRGILFPLEND